MLAQVRIADSSALARARARERTICRAKDEHEAMATADDELRSPTLGKRPDRVAKGSSPGPMTRRMRTALAAPEDLKLAGPKSLLGQLDLDEDDEDFTPGAESEVEEEFEGVARSFDFAPPAENRIFWSESTEKSSFRTNGRRDSSV